MIKAILKKRIKRTDEVESFRFSKEESLDFLPGQFTQLIFDKDNPQNGNLNKFLSFSSSPTKDYLEVTKKLRQSQFSLRLKNLKEGDEVYLKEPQGSCYFKPEHKKIAFLIGGIGITPVISIIEYIIDKKINTDAILIYSNRYEDIAFKDKLDSWAADNPNLKITYTLTDCEPKDKTCITGRVDKDLIIDKIDDWPQRVFFSFGPPKMVGAMKDLCQQIGCKQENIKAEIFAGY